MISSLDNLEIRPTNRYEKGMRNLKPHLKIKTEKLIKKDRALAKVSALLILKKKSTRSAGPGRTSERRGSEVVLKTCPEGSTSWS